MPGHVVDDVFQVAEPVVSQGGDYAELVRRVRAAGLLERSGARYAGRIARTFALPAAGWCAFLVVGNTWWQMLVAVYMAFAFAQVSFLGHDAGHCQAFPRRRDNDALAMVCGNLGVGVSFRWWFSKHNRHHAHPNNTGLDPDVRIAVLAYTPAQAGQKSGAARLVATHQHVLFIPLICLEAFWLHIASAGVVLRGNIARRGLEGATLVTHFLLYGAALALVLSPVRAIAFVVVHQMLLGLYLGSTFAPNHKGMQMFEGQEPTFLERQVLTSRNVTGSAAVDFLLGGLNYQIEHHLFPSMPRPNLRAAQRIVKPFCTEAGLSYCEKGIVASYLDVMRHLRAMGRI